jgi:5-methylcytosine-specific restriction endonuclease McrA
MCDAPHTEGEHVPPSRQAQVGVYKRGAHWHSIRRRIVARDKVCQKCGAQGRLQVHQKIPFRCFDDPDIANDDSNLVALCPPCHRCEDARSICVEVHPTPGAELT